MLDTVLANEVPCDGDVDQAGAFHLSHPSRGDDPSGRLAPVIFVPVDYLNPSMSDTTSAARERLAGELYVLPVSPWSHRVILTLRHSRAPVDVFEYRIVVTELMIWARQGFPSGLRVTAPVMFLPGRGWVMGSHEIARVIDGARAPGVPTLFPEEHGAELRRAVELGETLLSFWRGLAIASVQKDPHLAVELNLPKPLQGLPFVNAVTAWGIEQLAKKYRPETDACSESAARAALEELTVMLKRSQEVDGMKYLFAGRLTYADIVVGAGLSLDGNETSVFEGLPIASPFGGEFPDLRAYAKGIVNKFARKKDVEFPPPRYDVHGNVVQ